MTREKQRLVILSLLRDDPRRDPEQSDLDAALDRILAQREEISRLEDRLARLQDQQREPWPRKIREALRVIRGGEV